MKPTDHATVNIISPEKIQLFTLYTITINPDDDHQFWGVDDRIEAVKKVYLYQLKVLKNIADIDIYMEISRSGRLHWHGTIEFKTNVAVRNFFLHNIRVLSKSNQIEIDTIENIVDWLNYCTKSRHLIDCRINTEMVLKDNPLPPKSTVKYRDYFTEDKNN